MSRPVPRPAGIPSSAAALVAILVAATLGSAVTGCGKKGEPLPPIRQIPAATKDFQASQRGDRLLLSLPFPRTTAAGTPLSAVSEVTVWRLEWDGPATTAGEPPTIDQRQFIGAAVPGRMLSGKDLQAAVRGDRIALELPLATAAEAPAARAPEAPEAPGSSEAATTAGRPMLTLAVKTQGPTGEESGLSNLVTFAVAAAPEPPSGLELEAEAGGVRLRWEYPDADEVAQEPATGDEERDQEEAAAQDRAEPTGEAATMDQREDTSDDDDGTGILGFNVYRRLATEREYGAPVRTVGSKVRALVDESALFGQRYLYTVTAVGQRQPVLVESRLGEEAEVDYQDRFAPSAPTGVVALVQEGQGDRQGALQVRIVWRPVEAQDAAGYLVYRRSPTSQEFRRITEAPLTDTALVDPEVTSGASYTYRVSAVDRNGNESEPSEQVTARVR